MNLSQINKFSVHKRHHEDTREVLKSMPNKIPALIIHKRCLINTGLGVPMVPENFCLECTFLKDGGIEDIRYTTVLCRINDVITYLTKSKTNVVVSLLD